MNTDKRVAIIATLFLLLFFCLLNRLNFRFLCTCLQVFNIDYKKQLKRFKAHFALYRFFVYKSTIIRYPPPMQTYVRLLRKLVELAFGHSRMSLLLPCAELALGHSLVSLIIPCAELSNADTAGQVYYYLAWTQTNNVSFVYNISNILRGGGIYIDCGFTH